MGSLMAGWDSPTKSVKLDRNDSMTKVEIATYWKSKKNEEEVHGVLKSTEIAKEDEEGSSEKVFKSGWWNSSKWAFLNEPPVIVSETPFRYASQFHVAQKHIDNSNHHVAANDIKT